MRIACCGGESRVTPYVMQLHSRVDASLRITMARESVEKSECMWTLSTGLIKKTDRFLLASRSNVYITIYVNYSRKGLHLKIFVTNLVNRVTYWTRQRQLASFRGGFVKLVGTRCRFSRRAIKDDLFVVKLEGFAMQLSLVINDYRYIRELKSITKRCTNLIRTNWCSLQ